MAAVNNDGDLAIDLAEGEDVEELLLQWMEKEGKTNHPAVTPLVSHLEQTLNRLKE